jgi:hypothetical protein
MNEWPCSLHSKWCEVMSIKCFRLCLYWSSETKTQNPIRLDTPSLPDIVQCTRICPILLINVSPSDWQTTSALSWRAMSTPSPCGVMKRMMEHSYSSVLWKLGPCRSEYDSHNVISDSTHTAEPRYSGVAWISEAKVALKDNNKNLKQINENVMI